MRLRHPFFRRRRAPRHPLALLCALLSIAATSAIAQPPSNGLIAYWPFSGNANDASGNGHHGVVSGADLVPDRFGNPNGAYRFDGIADYIAVPHANALMLDSSFTICAWVKYCMPQIETPMENGGAGIVTKGHPRPVVPDIPTQGFGLMIDHAMGFTDFSNGYTTGFSQGDGEWHLVTLVYDYVGGSGPQMIDYGIDGNRAEGSSEFSATNPYVTEVKEPLLIGKLAFNGYNNLPDLHFNGAIDDVRLYDRALSAAEIEELYDDGGWPVPPPPPPSISLSLTALDPTSFCANDPHAVRMRADGVFDSIRWEPADGLDATDTRSVTARPLATTAYTVTAYAFGADPPCTDTLMLVDTITVTVEEPPIADAGVARYVCALDTVTLGGPTFGGTPPYRYEWSPSTGLSDSTAQYPRVAVMQEMEYRLVVIDAKGCRDTDAVTVTVLERPRAELRVAVGGIHRRVDTAYRCRGTAGVPLSVEGSGGNPPYTFRWSGAGLDRADSSHVLAGPDTTTTYIVAIDDAGLLCTGYDTVVVVPVDPPEADAGTDVEICVGDATALGSAAEDRGRLRYAWSPAVGLDDALAARPMARPEATTTYTLLVTDTITGCVDDDRITVTVRDARVTAAMPLLDVGTLDGCRNDTLLSVRLDNAGVSDAVITEWRSDLAGVSLLGGSRSIPAGGSVDLPVRFAPAAAGSYVGSLTLLVGSCGDSVVIGIIGAKERSSLGVDIGAIDYGAAPHCAPDPRDTIVVVTNAGADAVIEPGLVAAPWHLLSPSLPTALPAGASLAVTLRYAPQTTGIFLDELRLPFTAGTCSDTLRVALAAAVDEAILHADHAAIDFGLLDGCTDRRDTIITLTNRSTIPITITGADLPDDYTIIDESMPIDLPAGASHLLRLRVLPSTTGARSGTMRLRSLPCSAIVEIPLHAEKRGVVFALPDTLDVGELVACAAPSASRPLSIMLTGSEGTTGSIASVTINGPFSSDIVAGTTLLDGQASNGTVTFTPTATGPATGEMLLRLEPCGIERRVVLTGISSNAGVTATGIDFGLVPSGASRTGSVTYSNSGTTPIQIISLLPASSDLLLGTPDKSIPATLLPGESISVEATMRAGNGITASGVNAIVDMPCDTIVLASITIEGESSGFSRIVLPTVSAAPGEPVDFELSLGASSGLDEANARRFRAEVAVEPSVLRVDDATPWSIVNERRVIMIEGERKAGADLLATVAMTATLGEVEVSDISLLSFEWIDAANPIVIDTANGTFTLAGLCREGGVRLFDAEREIAITSISPNPASDRIAARYSITQPGMTRMIVVDARGATVREVFAGLMLPGLYLLDIDIDPLAGGSYLLLLETPTDRVSRRLEIVR